jgi:hypothetical protein
VHREVHTESFVRVQPSDSRNGSVAGNDTDVGTPDGPSTGSSLAVRMRSRTSGRFVEDDDDVWQWCGEALL